MKAEQPKYSFNPRFRRRKIHGLVNCRMILFGIITISAFGIPGINAQTPTPVQKTEIVKEKTEPDKTTIEAGKDTGTVKTKTEPDKTLVETEEQDKDKKDDPKEPKKPKRGSLIFAPIPIKSPAFGAGLVLGGGYVFKLNTEDKLSPPSSLGAAVAFTNNGTRGLVIGGRLYFAENKYQTTFAIGKGRANYEYYGIGRVAGQPAVSVTMKQSGAFFFGEFMRNFGKKIFIGPRYQYRKLSARLGDRVTPGGFEIPAIDVKSTTAAIGFHIQRDLRDNGFYPTKGSLFDFKADFFAKALGSNRNYQTYGISYNGYHSLGKKQVLAYRAMVCSASDNTPFFDLCLFGSNSDLRGYTTGQYQDHRMFATQVEYRRELPWRLGLAAFGGVGGVARYWDKLRFDQLLPAGGVGLRFKLDKTHNINYRVDLGFGRNGYTLSMSVTEAF